MNDGQKKFQKSLSSVIFNELNKLTKTLDTRTANLVKGIPLEIKMR
ncbi:hypothetical protein SAMN04488589_0379 [Methanolobus vulcani]|jgi:hypothetical protein|uniref:Uncharacterized protein n=1 Tax=Methanolobus vulcani TaxID=38026 RepID=A0A7Z7FBL7_9EURY|nr:hypothetical protein [Methanolobus sp.]SDF33350.1 hypothetical protein SAMN04488589_0379 [Methanolobus vulcani]